MSLESLTNRDTITVFIASETQDDMMGAVEASPSTRVDLQCRMVPMSVDEKIKHRIALLEEAFLAYFSTDPELTLNHKVIYNKKVYNVSSYNNASGQGWMWEAALTHDPGFEISA